MKPELLNEAKMPYAFSSRKLAGEVSRDIDKNSLTLGELEKEKLKKIEQVLNHPELDSLIDEGKLTLGIIKPKAFEGRGLPDNDEEATEVLLSEIGGENIVFKFSTQLNPTQVEDFYGDVKDKYSQIKADPENTVWDTLYRFSQSGPLTFLLIYREEGDAIQWWRTKMGKTQPKDADPLSIRGRFGVQERLPNNLTHGSDSRDSVRKELGVLKNVISTINCKVDEISSQFPSYEILRSINVISEKDYLISVKRIFDSGISSQSYIYGYSINYLDEKNDNKTIFLKEKNILSFAADLKEKAAQELARIEKIKSIGIPVPKTYGLICATIYQEFIVSDLTEEMLTRIQKTPTLDTQTKYILDQLINIGSILDKNGFIPLNFLNDIIFDGSKNQFLYLDGGNDLGDSTGVPQKCSQETLLQKFPEHTEYIKTKFKLNEKDISSETQGK